MPSLTKEQLVVKIKELGETPPSEWKHKQLLARYAELKELEQEKNKNGATNILTEMNKASRKKSTLQDFLQNRLAMTITGNETIPRLLALGNQRVMENTVPQDSDVMGFGQYSNMTYQEVRDYHPKYIQWCRTTMSEDEVSWQMRRFMKWVEMKTNNQIMGINSKVKLQPEPRMDISKKPCEGVSVINHHRGFIHGGDLSLHGVRTGCQPSADRDRGSDPRAPAPTSTLAETRSEGCEEGRAGEGLSEAPEQNPVCAPIKSNEQPLSNRIKKEVQFGFCCWF